MRLIAAILMLTLLVTAHADEACRLSEHRLIEIAKFEYAQICVAPRKCRYRVMEDERSFRCAVQISLVNRDALGREISPDPGAYQLLLVSNEGAVLARVKGM